MDEKSLSHTSWNCKYHIVLVPKYRRKVIYGKLRKDIGKILRTLCDYKHVEIIEAHAMPDHIHMLVSIPPKLAVADFMGYLKGKSTLMIFERHANPAFSRGVMILKHVVIMHPAIKFRAERPCHKVKELFVRVRLKKARMFSVFWIGRSMPEIRW